MDKFTHLAKIYGFKCYFNINNNEVLGTNWFNETMIGFFVWIESTFSINHHFEIKIIKQL
jgi:hypothetical protein